MTVEQQRIPLSVERLRAIALEGFDEGVATARARRAQAGLAPVKGVGTTKSIGEVVREHLNDLLNTLIREPEDLSPRRGDDACPRCQDAGWVVQRLTDGTIQPAPPLARCNACLGFRRVVDADALAARVGIGPRQRVKTFSTFQEAPGSEAALYAVTKWASDDAISDDIGVQSWLVVSGERGSGKTHLSLAAANFLADAGLAVRWYYTADLVDHARSLYGQENGEAAVLAFRRELARLPILILDEFGALSLHATEWAVNRFMEPLLDARYRDSKPTLFTLKGTAEQVREHISESIGRRMQDDELCVRVVNAAPQWTKR